MKIYFAGRYRDADIFRALGETLKRNGHEIVSRWIYLNRRAGRAFEVIPVEEKAEIAREDVEDVHACDILVLLSTPIITIPAGRGGKHVEFGIALALGKRICVMGARENVFHWYHRVELFQNIKW